MTIVLALDSPLDGWADELFWAHMLQHVLLLTVAPPLILLGRPWPRMWRALPLRSRTPLLISKRSAKSAPQRILNSQLIDSGEVLETVICSSAPPPTSRRRRTATLWARRRGVSGFVRKNAAES